MSTNNANFRAENATKSEDEFIRKHWSELSESTRNAKWINSTDQHEDYPGQTLATRSHDVIKHWAEERGAAPATVPNDTHDGYLGVMRLQFPGYGGQGLISASWEEWFNTFDHGDLVFDYQETLSNGNQSNFFQLDSPHTSGGG
ncbi:MAG: hypothetical protein ACRDFS_09880 [Chloroflexota bacterium]